MEIFQPNPASLSKFEVPDWFRDAKFGIYCHWGPQCVAMCDGWYARNLYNEGHWANKYHVKHYGHPSIFGYKDIIMLWKAEKFNPDQIVSLFKEAGAKYFTPVAVHHDNFDLWNSKYTRWNSVKMGPKCDIVQLWKEAAEKYGLIFGVTTHLERSYSWMQLSHHSDKIGPFKGIPYDGENPEFQDLYFENHGDDNFRSPLNPSIQWREQWKNRMKDLIDNYHPQLLYFDGACPFLGEDQGKSGMEIISHFYNDNKRMTKGKSNGVHFIKKIVDHGIFISNICLVDYEGHAQKTLDPEPWQTDISIGDWFYRKFDFYKSTSTIIHELVDIVSKNGNLLLNIPLRPDGTLNSWEIRTLKQIGKWMKINGEAIYETRPWKIAVENDCRFTKKERILYLTKLNRSIGRIIIKSLSKKELGNKIDHIIELESGKIVQFDQSETKLTIKVPLFSKFMYAKVFKIFML
jgi:alpha-L-fucosidase